MGLYLGANSQAYDGGNPPFPGNPPSIATSVPGMTTRRVYDGDIIDGPASEWVHDGSGKTKHPCASVWPGSPGANVPWPGMKIIYSIRPKFDVLMSGALDADLKALLKTAPSGASLAIFHEAQNLNYPAWVTPKNMAKMNSYFVNLCASSLAGFGVIFTGPASSAGTPWVGGWDGKKYTPYCGLDWVGYDFYDWYRLPGGHIDTAKVLQRLTDYKQLAKNATSKTAPPLVLPETNSPYPGQKRADWFDYVAGWLAANNGNRMCTFWNTDGKSSGPWTANAIEIAMLKSIIKRYG